MTFKYCTKCHTLKPFSDFGKNQRGKHGLRADCKCCARIKSKSDGRSKKGLLNRIFQHQRRNCKARNHPMPDYTLSEFQSWAFNQSIFHALYNQWVIDDYDKNSTPSFDRIDDYQGYSIDRLQIISWRNHIDKSSYDRINGVNNKISKSVTQMTKNGVFIAKYHSQHEAYRVTNIHNTSISACCLGKLSHAGGFKWSFDK